MHSGKCSKQANDFKRIFSKVYSLIFSKSALKKSFENSETTSKNFFRRCIHDSFQSLHLRKFSKQTEKLQRIFFEGLFMIIFQNIHPGK